MDGIVSKAFMPQGMAVGFFLVGQLRHSSSHLEQTGCAWHGCSAMSGVLVPVHDTPYVQHTKKEFEDKRHAVDWPVLSNSPSLFALELLAAGREFIHSGDRHPSVL